MDFEQLQAELARQKRFGRAFSGNGVFTSRPICGAYYGRKVLRSNDR